MQKVINFFAGPGAGKSTTATGVFSLLKMHDLNVEYVSEVAKDLAWEGTLDDAHFLDIMGNQLKRMERLRDKVDYIVCDSPLLMQAAYSNSQLNKDIAAFEFHKWANYNYFVKRTKPFNPKGRNHNAEESHELDCKIHDLVILETTLDGHIEGNYHGINHVVHNILLQEGKTITINLEGKIV